MMTGQMEEGEKPALLRRAHLRGVTVRNRVIVSPMCQYSAGYDGLATDFHMVHLGQFALGGAGIVFTEATGITAQGRISGFDLGLYNDAQLESLRPVAAFLKSCGATPGIQLSHAGRKASGRRAWFDLKPLDEEDAATGTPPWEVVAPSAVGIEGWIEPRPMSRADIAQSIRDWAEAARRAVAAGFEVIEIHGAHGYLIHQFLSPATNRRDDEYGGELKNRMRYALEVVEAVRAAVPDDIAVFFRVSALDGTGDLWTLDDTVVLARELKHASVDVIDCSTGGIRAPGPTGTIPRDFGFQVPYAHEIRQEADIATVAVGMIVDPRQANDIVAQGKADFVALGRELLANPYWTLHAARALIGGYSGYPDPYRGWLERRESIYQRMKACRSADG